MLQSQRVTSLNEVIAETARTRIRKLTPHDAPFVLAILNDPAFVEYVGDKNVRSLDDARHYIVTVPMASYERYGFGHYLVELRTTHVPIGLCSLVRRDWLDDVDIGFAFLAAYRRRGYAYEASIAVLDCARHTFGLARIVAIVHPTNAASIALLEKLGFAHSRMTSAPGDSKQLAVFATSGARV